MRIAFAAALLAACLPRLAAADEFTDTVESALQAYRGGDIDGARADLDFASQLLASAKAKGLTTFLPAAPEGWTREEGEDQTAAMAMFGGGVSSAAVYRKGGEEFTLTLIADSPMVSSVAAMLGGVAGISGMETRRIKRQVFAVHDGQVQGVVDGRVLVSAEGSATADEMFAVIEQMDFDALKSF